jgi:hypothetical protein
VAGRGRWHLYGGRYHDISVAHISMVCHKYLHQWRTQGPCATDMPATFSRGWAHLYPWRMDLWCPTDLCHMCGARPFHVPRMWGPDTPGYGARWGPHMRGAPLVWCATHKVVSVAHIVWCAMPTYPWSTET